MTSFSPRRSFAAKLLIALLGTLAVVLAVAFAAVRSETQVQVERAVARAAAIADTTFRSIEAVQRARLAEAAERVALGRRAVAALEAAIESGEVDALIADVDYEIALTQLPADRVMLVLTDPDGRTVVARAAGRPLTGDDPAEVTPLVDRMYETGEPEVRAYRVVDGVLYNVQASFLQLGARPVGTFTLGLPLGDEEAATLGSVAGSEVCFVAGGQCVASTSGVQDALRARLIAQAVGAPRRQIEALGGRWSLSATPLDASDASLGARAIAVPLDPVLLPFDRISRTLVLAGLAALALSALLGAVLARGLTRPVRALVRATGRIAEGDYDVEVPVEGKDELALLAGSFNEMATGLRLKERYRGVLDKVVSREVADELMKGVLELGGENREVTVLFGDVRGFTPLTRGMEPQRVIRLLNECMTALSAAVDAEGGVVDKYVGDEIMAVFGAPLDQPDHAARALRAARRMRAGMRAINAERVRRSEAPIQIGVGINTGRAVAGNMGSPQRLNYTVLGETVNMAARVCSTAVPDQILATGATVAGAGMPAQSIGMRCLKGFSEEVELFAIDDAAEGTRVPSGSGAAGTVTMLLLALGVAATPAHAQVAESGLPTLEDLGLWWSTADGAYQIGLSGRMDLELYVPSDEPAWLIPEREPFAAGRMRLFADAFAGERVYASAELRVDRGETPRARGLDARLEQLFVRARVAGPLELQLGRFASPFGGYAQRHHTVTDPFVRPPLSYEWRTIVCPGTIPANVDGFMTWQNRPDEFRHQGAPVVWNVPYQWGAIALFATGRFDARFGWMNSAASSAPAQWSWDSDRLEHGAWVASVGARISPELRLGASWTRGPYLEPLTPGALPAGAALEDYEQELLGVEAVFSGGPFVLRGEAFHDRWDVPNMEDDPVDLSWYLEGQTDLMAGLWVAARLGAIHYQEVEGGAIGPAPWDHDVRRIQLSAGHRLARNLEAKLEWMHTDMEGPLDTRDDLLSMQLWWAY